MKLPPLRSLMPEWKSLLLAVSSAVLLILAFPDFEYWFLAWFGLVPLLWAIERERESLAKSFVLGWLWGVAGLLLGVPILMVVKSVCDRVDGLKPVGEFLGA